VTRPVQQVVGYLPRNPFASRRSCAFGWSGWSRCWWGYGRSITGCRGCTRWSGP